MSALALHAEVKSVDDSGAGGWTAVASAPTLDRDGEIIDPGALRWPGERVPVHDSHFGELIGSARPYYRDQSLWVDGAFASTPRAQEVRTLVVEGHLTSMSVVFFDSKKRKDDDGVTHVIDGELLAVDWAPIPSNREAQVLVARAYAARRGGGASARLVVAHTLASVAAMELELLDAKPKPAQKSPRAVLAEADRLLRSLRGDHR